MLDAPLGLLSTNWHNYVVTYDGDSVKLYADTILVNAAQYQIVFINSTQPLFIGLESPELGGQFEGTIDDIRIYNRPLAQSEIKQLFTPATTKILYHTPNSLMHGMKINIDNNRISALLPNLIYDGQMKAEIINSSGKQMYSSMILPQNGILNFSATSFPAGKYFISVIDKNNKPMISPFTLTK